MAKKERKRLRLTKRQAIAGAVVLAIIAVALYFIFRKRPQPEVHPTVVVETVTTDDMEIYGEYVGRIRAQQFVEIRARVEGYLEEMLFEEGTYIKKDQVLFVIDPKLYKARVDGARAQLQKDKALELKAKRDLDRIRPLFEQNAASQLDLDNAIASYESAVSAVIMSEADLAQAELALGYTTVRSPISGYISERNVDIGTLVGPGGKSLLATIVKKRHRTGGLQHDRPRLPPEQGTQRKPRPSGPDTRMEPLHHRHVGRRLRISLRRTGGFRRPAGRPADGYFLRTCRDAQSRPCAAAGTVHQGQAAARRARGAVVVPSKAVIIEKGGAFIYVIRPDNVAERRFIELGPETDNMMIVERGLIPGERIVVEGYHKLMPGMTVEIVEPVAGEAAAEGMDNNAEE